MFPKQSGPCVICGDTNYSLSCGGPSICPKCDCGQFDAATVEKQAKIISSLRTQVREAFYAGFFAFYGPTDVSGVDQAIRDEDSAWRDYQSAQSSH